MARVVETVLTSWGAVQIDDDLQTILASPIDSFVKVWELALDVWFAYDGSMRTQWSRGVWIGSLFLP